MSSSLPPEILDPVIDHLHDGPTTLKTCCVVSKSWVPRTRRHLFARVTFYDSKSHVQLWKKAFPDPSNSPAHHTRTLSITLSFHTPVITAADAGVDGWICTFRNVVDLQLSGMDLTSLIPFYGLSPTVRSLTLTCTTSNVFDLICSFPLLEDLALGAVLPASDADGWNAPLTSPKLTGTLDLRMLGETRLITRRLLDLPGGLRFSKIFTLFFNENAEALADLVSSCSDTLEVLSIRYRPQGAFPSAPVISQQLIAACRHSPIWSASA